MMRVILVWNVVEGVKSRVIDVIGREVFPVTIAQEREKLKIGKKNG